MRPGTGAGGAGIVHGVDDAKPIPPAEQAPQPWTPPQPGPPQAPQAGPPPQPEQRAQPEPSPSGGPAPEQPPARRRRPWLGRALLLILVAAGGAALVAGSIGFFAYDRATRIDRSAPDVAVDNYLRALLVERDEARSRLYACSNGARLGEIEGYRADTEQREGRYATRISVSWGGLTVTGDRRSATVVVETRRTVAGGAESDVQRWRFEVLEQDGWRVCGAVKEA